MLKKQRWHNLFVSNFFVKMTFGCVSDTTVPAERLFFSFTQILNQLFVFGLLVKRSSFKTSPWALLNRDFPSCSIRFIEKTSGTFF